MTTEQPDTEELLRQAEDGEPGAWRATATASAR
jgi:hypothetical protein